MTILNQQALRENSCVLALPLTSKSGTTTYDSTRYSDVKISGSFVAHSPHDATINGDCVMHVGKDGQGLMYFDGTGDTVYTGTTNEFTMPGDFTVALWVLPTGIAGDHYFVSVGSAYNTGVCFVVSGTTNVMSAYCVGNGFTGAILGSSTGWRHIAMTRTSGSAKLYLDCVLMETVSNSSTVDNAGYGCIIGGNSTGINYYTGYLRGPWIFKKALDITQLRELMELTRPDYI